MVLGEKQMIGETSPAQAAANRPRCGRRSPWWFRSVGATVPQLLPLDLNARYTAAATLAPTQGPAHLSALPQDMKRCSPSRSDGSHRAGAGPKRSGCHRPAFRNGLPARPFYRRSDDDRSLGCGFPCPPARYAEDDHFADRKLLTLTATAGNAVKLRKWRIRRPRFLQQEMKATPRSGQDDPVERARKVLEQAQVALDNLPLRKRPGKSPAAGKPALSAYGR